MPPQIALVLCVAFIVYAIVLDRRESRVSGSLWVPTLWFLLISSKNASAWVFSSAGGVDEYDILMEGSPFDRNVYLSLIVVGVLVLTRRRLDWADLVSRNRLLLCLALYGLLSVLWSDYTFIALKRWIKAGGHFVMVLIVLTEVDPLHAVRTLMRRTAYVLVPLSTVLIKYYPHLGIKYSPWSGHRLYVGVSTSKNMLGALCLVSGVFLTWDLLNAWRNRRTVPLNSIFYVGLAVMGLVFWNFRRVNSATALVCFVLAVFVLVALTLPVVRRDVRRAAVCFFAAVAAIGSLEFAFDLSGTLLGALERDSTLTGRTELWAHILSMDNNVLLGAGYESFWLGDRLEEIWKQHWWRPNQAHNGYIDMYIQLGLVGLVLLFAVLVSSFRQALRLSGTNFEIARLFLALLVMSVVYNLTEAASRGMHPIWFVIVLCTVSTPGLRGGGQVEPAEAEPRLEHRPALKRIVPRPPPGPHGRRGRPRARQGLRRIVKDARNRFAALRERVRSLGKNGAPIAACQSTPGG